MIKVSIVIPVYNASKYLRKTLDSVCNQTYKQWEALLIEDGSQDESGRICDEYSACDARFKTIHKKNEGVGAARNLGITMATGEYLCFLDSDDQMKPTYLEIGLSKIGDADLLIFSFERWNYRSDKMILTPANVIGKKNCQNYLYELKEGRGLSEFFCFPWNKFYRRSIIVDNHVTFPTDISLREDEIFAYRYLHFVTHLIAISDILIEYNDFPSGLSAKRLAPNKSVALADHLIAQTKCDNSTKSKRILFFRAMIYMVDAINNTSKWTGKNKIAKHMLEIFNNRTFEFDASDRQGLFRLILLNSLEHKSLLRIKLLAILFKIRNFILIYFLRDKNLKRWGINV